MSPQQLQEFNTMKSQIAALTERLDMLNSSATIPFAVDVAMSDRIIKKVPIAELSTKSATSENVGFTISGTPYTVLGAPDGFLEITLKDGSKKFVPYYN